MVASRRRLVIVGAGTAGVAVVEGAREGGFDGEVLLLSGEDGVPHERMRLTEGLADPSRPPRPAPLRPARWYEEHQVDFQRGHRIRMLDPESRTLTTSHGVTIRYDDLVLSTGVRSRRPYVADSLNSLQDRAEAARLHRDLHRFHNVLVLGSGPLGVAVAVAARRIGKSVTLVTDQESLLASFVPTEIGERIGELFTDVGIDIACRVPLAHLRDNASQPVVTAADGRAWSAPVVVTDFGSEPDVALALRGGVDIDDGIVVDERGATSRPHIYAAGSVANRPSALLGARHRPSGSACSSVHGRVVGRGLAGTPLALDDIPFCSHAYFGMRLTCVGWPMAGDHTVVPGEGVTVASVRGGRVVGVSRLGSTDAPLDREAVSAWLAAGSPGGADGIPEGA